MNTAPLARSLLRSAACVLMTCLLIGMMCPGPALAAQGTLAVSARHNAAARYNAYLIFAADVDEEGVATHLNWASDAVRDTTLAYLDTHGYTEWLDTEHPGTERHQTAQLAAAYVSLMISGSPGTTPEDGTPRTTAGRSFATGLARALADGMSAPDLSLQADEEVSCAQGLWLVVTDPLSATDADEAGTAPLWLSVGPTRREAVEKSAVPTVRLEVCEDATGAWGSAADANRGQALPFRITGTLPKNLDAFERYHYRLAVSIPEGTSVRLGRDGSLTDALTVRVGSSEVPIDGKHLTATLDDGILSVDFADLRSEHWTALSLDDTASVCVDYQACLGPKARVGMPGNTSIATLAYTNDPISLQDGITSPSSACVFTYQLRLRKVDAQTGAGLAGAAFLLRALDTAQDDATPCYVQRNGSLGTDAYAFVSDEAGIIEVTGLDEGSYQLVEEQQPTGYLKPEKPLDITITAQLEEFERAVAGIELKVGSEQGDVVDVRPEEGALELRVRNERAPTSPVEGNERLPQTGVGPVASLLIATGLIIAGLSLVRSSK